MEISWGGISIIDNMNLSSEEKVVGKFLDGRNIYRCTFDVGQIFKLETETYKEIKFIDYGITNVDMIIRIFGCGRDINNGYCINLPFVGSTLPLKAFNIGGNSELIRIYSSTEMKAYNYKLIISAEYIKKE